MSIRPALYSKSLAVDARPMLLSGMHPPKYIDQDDVEDVFGRLCQALQNKVLYSKYQDTVDHSIEEWVAKAVLVRGLHFNGRTVSDFFQEYEAYAAE